MCMFEHTHTHTIHMCIKQPDYSICLQYMWSTGVLLTGGTMNIPFPLMGKKGAIHFMNTPAYNNLLSDDSFLLVQVSKARFYQKQFLNPMDKCLEA